MATMREQSTSVCSIYNCHWHDLPCCQYTIIIEKGICYLALNSHDIGSGCNAYLWKHDDLLHIKLLIFVRTCLVESEMINGFDGFRDSYSNHSLIPTMPTITLLNIRCLTACSLQWKNSGCHYTLLRTTARRFVNVLNLRRIRIPKHMIELATVA